MQGQDSGDYIASQVGLHTGQALLRKFDALKAASRRCNASEGNFQGSLLTVALIVNQWLFDESTERPDIVIGVGVHDRHQLLHLMEGLFPLALYIAASGFS